MSSPCSSPRGTIFWKTTCRCPSPPPAPLPSRSLSTCHRDDLPSFANKCEQISRSELFLVDLVDTTSNIAALEDARDVADQSTLDPEPFSYSTVFLFTEQFLVIYDELIMNFVLSLVAVAVLSSFILGRISIVILICLTVVRLTASYYGGYLLQYYCCLVALR